MKQLKKWPEDEVRFKELILYACQKCAVDPKFGATKLNKIATIALRRRGLA